LKALSFQAGSDEDKLIPIRTNYLTVNVDFVFNERLPSFILAARPVELRWVWEYRLRAPCCGVAVLQRCGYLHTLHWGRRRLS